MKKRFKPWQLLLLAGCLSAGQMSAVNAAEPQQKSTQQAAACKGFVIDELGEPVFGATVKVAGTTNAAMTDSDGKFSLTNVKKGSKVVISYVGYKSMEVVWNGQNVDVTLEPLASTLNELVVVGFGVQKKANLTGAVSTVTGKEIAARPVNNVTDALQGMAPGLNVMGLNNGGQLNSVRSMNIRGTGTIGSGSSVTPLILIDGMEGDLNSLNPADVENISVLKDAAASSIYGSRAAGGVILVTTKNGREQKVTVNYSDSFRWNDPIGMAKMANSYQWANYMNQCSINGGGGAWFPDKKLEEIKKAMTDNSMPKMFQNSTGTWEVWDETPLLPIGNTDWLQEHFGKTAFSQEHNISISGGSDKYDFYLSGNMLDRDGSLVHGNDNSQRYTVNAKINARLSKYLKLSYSNRWTRSQYDSPSMVTSGYNEFYHNMMRYWPIVPAYDPNGYPVIESYIDKLENGGRYKTYDDYTDQQLAFLLTPIKGMNIRAEFNYRNESYNSHKDNLQAYGWNCEGVAYPRNPNGTGATVGSSVYEYNQRSNYFNPNIYGDYSFSLNEVNNFKVMAGFQSESYRYYDFSASKNDVLNRLPYLSMTNGKDVSVAGGTAAWATAGWFGRLNYDYAGRYLLEANLRYDGSSRFRSHARWNWSPSFSLGWNIAQEKFWENFTDVCNQLKARVSWGRLGNQNTSSWYPTYANMGYSPSSSAWLVNDGKGTTASMPGLISSSLTWEKNQTTNIGMDWGLLNNRLTGTFDYFIRKTIDMVGPGETLPGVLGASVPNVNNLAMTSRGWEFQISWRDMIGEVGYGITANVSDAMVTIDEYPNANYSLSKYYKGRRLGDIWGFTTIGIAKTAEEMQAHLEQLDRNYEAFHGEKPANPLCGQNEIGTGWGAGDIMYADTNGDGIVDWGEWTLDSHGDNSIIGNSTPRYIFGLNLEANWKGIDLKVFLQGVGKRDYAASGAPFWGGVGTGKWQAQCLEEHLDYFRPADTTDPLGPNLDAYYPAANWNGWRNTETQTRYLQDASYCRLKNVTIGYTFPQTLTRKVFIEKARLFFSGENLLTFTKFTSIGDPEMIEAYGATGFAKAYPISRTLSMGLNVTF